MAGITVTLTGVSPYDGPYRIDLPETELTNREWAWIKRYSGYQPANLVEAITAGDAEFWCAFTLILLRRAGRIQTGEAPAVFEVLQDAPYSAVAVEIDAAEEDDAGPPPPSSSSNGTTSGDDSSSSSETLVLPPKATGSLPSATSRSVPATSVS